MPEETSYTIEELAAQSGVKERNIRFYIAEGLMHPPAERGRYDSSHLVRLQFIRKLSEEYVRLDQIRRQLERHSDAEIAALLRREHPIIQESVPLRSEASPSRRENLMDYLRRIQEPNVSHQSTQPQSRTQKPAHFQSPLPLVEWEHHILADGVELHIRKPIAPEQQRLIDALLRTAQTSGAN